MRPRRSLELARAGTLAALIIFIGCKREAAVVPDEKAGPRERVVKTMRATATWYDVPADSRVAKRAEPGQFTAAQNSLPIGSRVRVTNLETSQSVDVIITDRGLSNAHQIDLCKGAAAQIGLVEKGRGKVKLEVME